MYLVHAELHRAGGAVLPEQAAQLINGCSVAGEGIEHVVVHPDADQGPLVGIFVLAARAEDAEYMAAAVCQRALDTVPELAGFTLRRCGARLVPHYYDQRFCDGADGRDMPRHD